MPFTLLILFVLACNTHNDIPENAAVIQGTFLAIAPIDDLGSRVVITYADEKGFVRNEEFYVGAAGSSGVKNGSERLIQEQPIYAGNRFKIEKGPMDSKTGVTAFRWTKLE